MEKVSAAYFLNHFNMRVRFWTSTEYSGFLVGLIRELRETGVNAAQCFQLSERSYRSAKSSLARLFLRFRQYVAYPIPWWKSDKIVASTFTAVGRSERHWRRGWAVCLLPCVSRSTSGTVWIKRPELK